LFTPNLDDPHRQLRDGATQLLVERGRAAVVILAVAKPTTTWYLLLSALLFSIGTFGVLVRRNPLVMFMCIELMLNAVNLSFVALAKMFGDIGGQTTVFFVLVVASFIVFFVLFVAFFFVAFVLRNRTAR